MPTFTPYDDMLLDKLKSAVFAYLKAKDEYLQYHEPTPLARMRAAEGKMRDLAVKAKKHLESKQGEIF